jgi:hypothetical protein
MENYELDRLVAEKVMGWDFEEYSDTSYFSPSDNSWSFFLVLNKVKKDGYYIMMDTNEDKSSVLISKEVKDINLPHRYSTITDKTLNLALCKAVLQIYTEKDHV